MNAPIVSRPREPGLYRRSPGVERHRVRGGGFTLVELQPGDQLQVVDLEGLQPCELLAFDASGRDALAALGLNGRHSGGFCAAQLQRPEAVFARARQRLAARGIDCARLPAAANLWPAQSLAGEQRRFTAESTILVLVGAPGEAAPVDRQASPTDLALSIQRANPGLLWTPPLPEPLADPIDEFSIRPGTAQAYRIAAGDYIQVLDVAGRQCSDFVALRQAELERGIELDLDQTVTRTLNGNAYPAPGLFSKFFDRQMQPMLEVVRDTVGRHDSFNLACTARYYESHGYFGHDNCSDNLSRVLAEHGVQARAGWPAINFFFNTEVEAAQRIALDEPWSRPGDYVLLRAMRDLVCASSACADDIDPANGWTPTDIQVRVYPSSCAFSKGVAHRMTPDAVPELTRETGFHPRTAALTRNMQEYRGFWLPGCFAANGPIDEYWACRERAVAIDLSALRKFEVIGPDAEALLQGAVTRDMRKLAVGQVVYTAICYPHGGMLDDATVFRLAPQNFRFVCGDPYCGVWLRRLAAERGLQVSVKSSTDQLHNLAVQGPRSRDILAPLVDTPPHQPSLRELGWFRFTIGRIGGRPVLVSRTGYTGELGYEIWCHPDDATAIWDAVWEEGRPHGLAPMGLAALDMVRIEAGLVFAGYEFCDQTDPFEAGIGFAVPAGKPDPYVGSEALARRRANPQRRLVGLEIASRECVGHGDCVHLGRAQVGVVTSGMRSPVLGRTIALARLDVTAAEPGTEVEIGKLDGQQKRLAARVVRFPHYDPDKTRDRA
jgi:aminomethyltransferase